MYSSSTDCGTPSSSTSMSTRALPVEGGLGRAILGEVASQGRWVVCQTKGRGSGRHTVARQEEEKFLDVIGRETAVHTHTGSNGGQVSAAHGTSAR